MKTFTMCAPVAAVVAGAFFFMSVPAAAADAPPPAEAVTSLANSPNPFAQVDTTSPEYAALKRLQADGLIKQHADLLKTGQPLTRYQAAVIAAEAINNAKNLMRDGNSLQLTQDDVAALRIVYDDVKDDLTALTARVNADERRLSALESKSGTGTQTVAQAPPAENPNPTPAPQFKPSFEIHGEFRIRPVLQNVQVASATTNAGVPIPNGTTLIRTGTQGDATVTTGSIGNGQMQSRMRLVAAGHLNETSDFIVRLSTEDIGGANNASLVHNDFSFLQYVVPNSGFTFYGGKLLYCCGTPWLPDGTGMIADAVPIGVAVKYTVPGEDPHKISAWASVASLKNAQTDPTQVTCPPSTTGFTQNIFAAHAEAVVVPQWKLQVQYLQEPAQCVTAFPSGSPTLLNNNANLQVGSFTIDHQFSDLFSGTLELLERFGNDPNTGTGWTDNGALYLGFKYGKFGVPYHATGDVTYVDSGQNSIPGNLDSIVNGVDSPWNFLLPFPNDVQTFDVGGNWFFGPNALLRLEYATAILRHNESTINNNIITGYRQNLLILTGQFNF